MVGRAAQGNPWALREIMGDASEPSREEVVAELLLFMRETVRELGEHRAFGFLKKFYGWYLGRGRFPRPFKQELVMLPTPRRGRGAAARSRPGRAVRARAAPRRAARPAGRGPARLAADLDLRRRLKHARGNQCFPPDASPSSSSQRTTSRLSAPRRRSPAPAANARDHREERAPERVSSRERSSGGVAVG